MKKRILIIIPAYNEEGNILKVYKSIINYNKKYKTNYNVIVINDCSLDKTSEICHKNNIPIIDLVHNLGIGGAVQTGYKYAFMNNYDIAVQFDGDGQHNIEYVKKIVGPIINNKADMVIGSRFIENVNTFQSTFMRRFGIKIISSFIKLFTKKRIYDTTSGFRACGKEVIEKFKNNYPIEYPEPISTVELLKDGYNIDEVSVKMNERKNGYSSIHTWKKAYYMINVILSIIMVGLRRDK